MHQLAQTPKFSHFSVRYLLLAGVLPDIDTAEDDAGEGQAGHSTCAARAWFSFIA